MPPKSAKSAAVVLLLDSIDILQVDLLYSWAKITVIFFFESVLKIVENSTLRSKFSTILSPTENDDYF